MRVEINYYDNIFFFFKYATNITARFSRFQKEGMRHEGIVHAR